MLSTMFGDYATAQKALKAYWEKSKKVDDSAGDRDIAIRVRVANLRRSYPDAHFRFDYKEQHHGAAIICYDCSPNEIWVWEVRPVTEEAAVKAQVDDHIRGLKESIECRARGKNVSIVRGPTGAFKPGEEYALGFNGYDEVLKVWSASDGVELYDVRQGDGKPAKSAFKLRRETDKIASQEETKWKNENYEDAKYGPLIAPGTVRDWPQRR